MEEANLLKQFPPSFDQLLQILKSRNAGNNSAAVLGAGEYSPRPVSAGDLPVAEVTGNYVCIVFIGPRGLKIRKQLLRPKIELFLEPVRQPSSVLMVQAPSMQRPSFLVQIPSLLELSR